MTQKRKVEKKEKKRKEKGYMYKKHRMHKA